MRSCCGLYGWVGRSSYIAWKGTPTLAADSLACASAEAAGLLSGAACSLDPEMASSSLWASSAFTPVTESPSSFNSSLSSCIREVTHLADYGNPRVK